MPTISALDPSVRYDDADQEAAQSRARDRDFMMRNWMQQQQLSQQQNMQNQDMGQRERMQSAELADRERMQSAELADRGEGRRYNGGLQMNMLEMGQKPQMDALGFAKSQYADSRNDGAATRDFTNLQGKYKTDMLRNAIEGSAGGAMGGSVAPAADPSAAQDARAVKFGLLGLTAPRDINQENSDFIRKIIMAKLASNPSADPGEWGAALKSGNPADMPKTPVVAIDPAQLEQSLGSETEQFGNQDNKLIGFDPTEENVQSIVRKRDQLAQAFQQQNRGMTPQQAAEKANFTISEKLRPLANNWGMDMVQRLKQALGISSAPQPATAPSGGMDMSEFPG